MCLTCPDQTPGAAATLATAQDPISSPEVISLCSSDTSAVLGSSFPQPCPALGPTHLYSDPQTDTQDHRPTSSRWIHPVFSGPDSDPDLLLDFVASRLWTCPLTTPLPDDLGCGLKLAPPLALPCSLTGGGGTATALLAPCLWYCTQLLAFQPSSPCCTPT